MRWRRWYILLSCGLLACPMAWATLEEPSSNLLWNYMCTTADTLATDCELVLVMQWRGSQDERYTRYCLNTDMGMSPTDEAGCQAYMRDIMQHGMELRGEDMDGKMYTTLTALQNARCVWVNRTLIGEFFQRHTHPEHIIVQEVHRIDGRLVLQPPSN